VKAIYKRFNFIFFAIFLALFVAGAAFYLISPQILSWFIQYKLLSLNIETTELLVSHPGLKKISVERFQGKSTGEHEFSITLNNIELEFSASSLLHGRLESIAIKEGKVLLSPLEISSGQLIAKLIMSRTPDGNAIQQFLLKAQDVEGNIFNIPFAKLDVQMSNKESTSNATEYTLKAHTNILDGSITVQNGQISNTFRKWFIPLTISDVSLEKVLSLYPEAAIEATGKINGFIPVLISENNVTIEDGSIEAKPPGGIIKYHGTLPAADPSSQMQFTLRAISDFKYQVLRASIVMKELSKLVLQIHLEGQNQKVAGDRPVHLNLNVEDDLAALIKSIRIAKGLTRAVKEHETKGLNE